MLLIYSEKAPNLKPSNAGTVNCLVLADRSPDISAYGSCTDWVRFSFHRSYINHR